MKLAVVCFPSFGGSGVVGSEEAVGLSRKGHEVHLVMRSVPARPLPKDSNVILHLVDTERYPVFENLPFTEALASKLIDLGRAHGLELIHAHYSIPHAMSGYLAKRALKDSGIKLVTSLHGSDVLKIGHHSSYRSVNRFVISESDAVIVPSRFLENEARKLLELPEDLKIDVIPNFVDTEHFQPDSGTEQLDRIFEGKRERTLVHVSNCRPVKRLSDTIEVLSRVRASFPTRLLIIGEGPDRAEAEQRARELHLTEHVKFIGTCSEFAKVLAQCDGFLLTSEIESFGLAALEALSCGVPVFGYRVGGVPAVVTSEVGKLVEPFHLDALADAVRETLSNTAVHQKLRRAARNRAEQHFKISEAMNVYERTLQRVCESEI